MLPRRNAKKQLHRVTVSSAQAEFLYANDCKQWLFCCLICPESNSKPLTGWRSSPKWVSGIRWPPDFKRCDLKSFGQQMSTSGSGVHNLQMRIRINGKLFDIPCAANYWHVCRPLWLFSQGFPMRAYAGLYLCPYCVFRSLLGATHNRYPQSRVASDRNRRVSRVRNGSRASAGLPRNAICQRDAN